MDNREELIRAFGLSGEEAAERPDSWLLLRAYERWGSASYLRLLGAFSVALWDARQRRLTLVRDPLGERVLFYRRLEDGVAFASAPKGLFALPGVERRLDEGRVSAWGLRCDAEGATYFEGVKYVPAGHCIELSPQGLKSRRFWSVDPDASIRFRKDEDYVEAARELFHEAVRCRLRSAHPVGGFMSGGLDSPSVACTALALKDGLLPVFTAIPREGFAADHSGKKPVDETPFVEAIKNRHPRLDVTYMRTGDRPLLDGLHREFEIAEMPFKDAFNRLWWVAILEQAQSRGIRVMLSGQEGNVTLGWCGIRDAREPRPQSKLATLVQQRASWVPRGLLQRFGFGRPGGPDIQGARRFIGPDARDPRQRPEAARAHAVSDDVDSRLSLWAKTERSGAQARAAWRAETGVEVRDPTVDRRVVEFCFAIPAEQFRRREQKRWLLRRLMKDVLPEAVVGERKRVGQSGDWYERFDTILPQLRTELESLQQCSATKRLIDIPRMHEALAAWPASLPRSADQRLYRGGFMGALMMGRFICWVRGAKTDGTA